MRQRRRARRRSPLHLAAQIGGRSSRDAAVAGERLILARAGIHSLGHGLPHEFEAWADIANPRDELCGALANTAANPATEIASPSREAATGL
jgi:hypothetical protein